MSRSGNAAYEARQTCSKCGHRLSRKASITERRRRADGGWDHWPTCPRDIDRSQLLTANQQRAERREAIQRGDILA